MVLAVDIGNTNITFGVLDARGVIRRRMSLATDGVTKKHVQKKMRNVAHVEHIVIVSVVPRVTAGIAHTLRQHFKRACIDIVGRDIRVPLPCAYNKREIGQDRLVTAFAAKTFYGLPILIIDFGTAVTFDAVSKNGTYLGGVIVPGIKMSLDSLSERTAMLPKTYLKRVGSFLGKDTVSSIRSGMVHGYASLCDGLIRLFRKNAGRNIRVVATGGDAGLISRYSSGMKRVDPDLSLKGLFLLAGTAQKKQKKS